jgi:hypothetical protein
MESERDSFLESTGSEEDAALRSRLAMGISAEHDTAGPGLASSFLSEADQSLTFPDTDIATDLSDGQDAKQNCKAKWSDELDYESYPEEADDARFEDADPELEDSASDDYPSFDEDGDVDVR